jgi:3-deoxy-manno-octulosonate cytidylyltransferase (CMP-KDO synthetase)
MQKILTVIPARYASTRFPGKPLTPIKGEPMVWQVYCRAVESGLENIVVATDDERISQAVTERGGKAMLTSIDHQSGTDRCGEVLKKKMVEGEIFDFVINLQGDEPFIQPEQIQTLLKSLTVNSISTLVKKIEDRSQLENPNVVKVIWSEKNYHAIYFSRLPIPYLRDKTLESDFIFYKHIGLYGFDANILLKLIELQPSRLEKAESLEQLRWLENGYTIKVAETNLETLGIDTLEDLLKIER